MYYEEQNIGGILHYRTSPKGKWIEMSKEQMTEKIISLKSEISRLINNQFENQ